MIFLLANLNFSLGISLPTQNKLYYRIGYRVHAYTKIKRFPLALVVGNQASKGSRYNMYYAGIGMVSKVLFLDLGLYYSIISRKYEEAYELGFSPSASISAVIGRTYRFEVGMDVLFGSRRSLSYIHAGFGMCLGCR